jgi:hypothetical protein
LFGYNSTSISPREVSISIWGYLFDGEHEKNKKEIANMEKYLA